MDGAPMFKGSLALNAGKGGLLLLRPGGGLLRDTWLVTGRNTMLDTLERGPHPAGCMFLSQPCLLVAAWLHWLLPPVAPRGTWNARKGPEQPLTFPT